jgi:monovalent cation/hydrogen antiporter
VRNVETVVLLVALATVVAAFARRLRGTKRPSPGSAWPRWGLARLNELADNGTAPNANAVIDRLRAGLQARIGTTRDRIDQDPDTEPEALPEKELRADLIAAENAELSRLYEDGTISAATRSRLQRSLDLEVTRLADRQR